MLELPLLIFYVLPIIEIVIYFQENQMEIVSEVILNTLFLGNLNFSADGTAHINGFRELGSATIGWLIIFELLSEVLEWMFKRRKKKFPGAKIASWSLAALYIGAGFSFAYTPPRRPVVRLYLDRGRLIQFRMAPLKVVSVGTPQIMITPEEDRGYETS